MYGLREQVGSRTEVRIEGVVGKLNYFPMVILNTFFHFWWWFWGSSFGVGTSNRVFGVGFFLLEGFWACGVGPSGFFGVGALYIIIEE